MPHGGCSTRALCHNLTEQIACETPVVFLNSNVRLHRHANAQKVPHKISEYAYEISEYTSEVSE